MLDSNLIFALDCVPVLQNRVFPTREAALASASGDLRIVQDPQTGLIHNQAFDGSKLVYDANYNNEQGLSPSFDAHLRQVAGIVQRLLQDAPLLEIGCGKARFLEQLQEMGLDILGCDPTYEGENPAIVREFYLGQPALRQRHVILRHVLEHIQHPLLFLQQLAATNNGGLIYIEVPCMDWIAAHTAWFDLFYEHVNYFRLCDLRSMFGKVLESGSIFGGQYIYIVADLASLRTPVLNDETKFSLPTAFRPSFPQVDRRLPIAIWGAASKGVLFALHAARQGLSVDVAVDMNPAKQGKYLPLTGIPVISPERLLEEYPAETQVIIMNPNYSAEIQSLSKHSYKYFEATLA